MRRQLGVGGRLRNHVVHSALPGDMTQTMSRHALNEKRPLLLASIAVAVAYYWFRDAAIPEMFLVALKGSAVGLLAIYAYLRHAHPDARVLTWMLGLGALGDITIEYDFTIGGLCFFLAHIFALNLFLRHRREHLTTSQKGVAVALLVLTPLIAWTLPADRAAAFGVAFYALTLGGMAGSAWVSTFPRYRVGLGAVLFVASDLLIFAELGPMAESAIPYLAIWPLYYVGQFLICIGVIQNLRRLPTGLRLASSR